MWTLTGIFFLCSSFAIGDSLFSECYDKIGCFSITSPFHNAILHLPQSPTDIDVKYKLFTKHNSDSPQFLTTDSDVDAVQSTNFDGSKNTKFIIHGYTKNVSKGWVINLKDAILEFDDVNVIIVDWLKGANLKNYAQAVANTRVVGALLALFMKTLDTVAKGKYFGRMHLIGNSLGAHVAGYAGNITGGIGRITGLDPAGPLFEDTDPMVRLDPTDASFVDVIHTDDGYFGIKSSLGHVDFYPNRGKTQPGCPEINYIELIRKLFKGEFKELYDSLICSHRRSRNLFIESINSACRFVSLPCKTCVTCDKEYAYMGYGAPEGNPRGDYCLSTNSEQPFCRYIAAKNFDEFTDYCGIKEYGVSAAYIKGCMMNITGADSRNAQGVAE